MQEVINDVRESLGEELDWQRVYPFYQKEFNRHQREATNKSEEWSHHFAMIMIDNFSFMFSKKSLKSM